MTMTITAIDSAEPSGQLRPWPNCSSIRLDEHHVLAAAKHARRHIGADRRNEDEDRAGDDAGLDQREDDARAAPGSASRRDRSRPRPAGNRASPCWHRSAAPSAADRHRPCRSGSRYRCRGSGSAHRMMPSLSRIVLMMPSLRMICSTAKVRIRRLVQNGMVIRNSQRSRRLLAARGDEIGGRETQRQSGDRRHQRKLHRAPEDRDMRVGKRKRVVENVAFQEHRQPGIGRELPFRRRHRGRASGTNRPARSASGPVAAKKMISSAGADSSQRSRTSRRSAALATSSARRHAQSFSICAASSPIMMPTRPPCSKPPPAPRLFCWRTMNGSPPSSRTWKCVSVPR